METATKEKFRSVMQQLPAILRVRPWWINALMLFCAYMALFYLPWDLFVKPVAEDQEVWFGWVFRGWMAKATEPLHWFVYAAGAWGFWKMRPWIWFWSALYTLQVAFSMFMWQLLDSRGAGLVTAVIAAAPFVVLSVLLLRARSRYVRAPAGGADQAVGADDETR